MTGLLRAELRRLFARRLVRILAAAAVVVVLIVMGRAFFVSDRNTAAAHRRAEQQAQQFSGGLSGGPDNSGLMEFCQNAVRESRPPPDVCFKLVEGGQVDAESLYVDPRFHSARSVPDGAMGVTVAVIIVGFVVGASFVGAEWSAGTMQALLFWEPRRGRVLVAKAVALLAGMFAFAAGLHLLVQGLILFVGATRGTTEGLTGGVYMSALLSGLRGLIAIAFAALLGFGIAGFARITGAALGVGFGYFVIVENLIRGFRPGWQRFLVSENTDAVVHKRSLVSAAHVRHLTEGTYKLTGQRATVTLAVYLALLLGAFYVTFRRRDVT